MSAVEPTLSRDTGLTRARAPIGASLLALDPRVNRHSTAARPASGSVPDVHPDRLGKGAVMTFPHRSSRVVRLLAAGLAAGALAAPPTLAGPAIGPVVRDTEPGATAIAVEPQPAPADAPVVVRTVDERFDWGSAVIGAGAAGAVVVLVSLGGIAYASRNRIRVAR